jgi:beta-galactosidase
MSSAALLLATAFPAGAGGAPAAAPARERILFNTDWRFVKGDPADTGDKLRYPNIRQWLLPTGARFSTNEPFARPGGELGDDVTYTQSGFNDSAWRLLNLPHDWGIEGPFIPGGDGATGRLPWAGIGWYRKHFNIPAGDQGRRISLDIDGAMSYAAVWCNGKFVGGWPYGYASWSVDLTPYLKIGGDNVLAIRLDNPPTSSRWYPGGGIYRNVWITKTAPVHVGQWGTYVTTPSIEASAATVSIKVNVDNDSEAAASVQVRNEVYELDAKDKRGKAIGFVMGESGSVAAHKSQPVATQISIGNPKLWSTVKPNRYQVVTTVEQDGKVLDTFETAFGIRTIQFTPTNGFLLNGKRVQINGVCDHHDLGSFGTAINMRALERQIEMLQEMGCNAIRTSHNPPAPELLELCDKMGMVVMDEAFDCWAAGKRANDYSKIFADWHEQDMRALLRRDRNHPSVVLWSIGNEINEQNETRYPKGAEIAQELARYVHEEDMTRPTCSACNSARPGSAFAAAIDVIGLNYQGSRPSQQQPYGTYLPFHETSPDRFVFGSETASTISSRAEYSFPVATGYGTISDPPGGRRGGRRGGAGAGADGATNTPPPAARGDIPGRLSATHQMSSYDLYYPSWATSPDTEFSSHDRFSFVGGEFVWTGWDYVGEPTPYDGANNPSRSSYFGIIDLAGFKKDRFFLYQAHWRSELPMAHILPHWNWPDRVGQVTPVHVYTSGDEAELFLNGKSLGRKKKEQYQYRIRWDDVVYQPGELKVVAYKKGKKWATDTMKTSGAAAKLELEPDRATIAADGMDISFVTLKVSDKSGIFVPRANNHIKFSVEGPGEIVTTDNGDATSFESFQSPERNAYNGMALVTIRGKAGKPGTIKVKAESDGLKTDTVSIKTR